MENSTATLLLIDDDPNILAIFGMALEEEGYQVIKASSGLEGLSLARKHLPDLILSDINMPGMDGKKLLETLREDEDLGTTQIVLMTGHTRAMNSRAGMKIGADDFLEKPFSHEELIQCVKARLLRAKVHWRIEERILSKIQGNVISTLPHELFTPLAGILGLIEVMRENFTEMSESEVQSFLELMEKSGWRLQRTLRNYLMILEFKFSDNASQSPPPLVSYTVQKTIEEQAEKVGLRHERTGDIQVELSETALICSEKNLAILVEELLDNACAFSAKGGTIQLSLDSSGLLQIQDHGRGMSEKQIREIRAFRQFDRNYYEQQGLGLGLFLCQQLAQRCGAQLQIESETGKGTRNSIAFKTPD